jgi:hypothetical protein
MFRKIALAAALALTATAGIARAEGEQVNAQESIQQLREGLSFAPTMSGIGARAVVTPGMERLTVVYDSERTRGLANGGTPMIVVDGSGSFRTVYGM